MTDMASPSTNEDDARATLRDATRSFEIGQGGPSVERMLIRIYEVWIRGVAGKDLLAET
jgi:hypothetical protein